MSWLLMWDEGRGSSRGQAGGGLRWPARPCGGVQGRGTCSTLFLLLTPLYLLVGNLLQLCMRAVVFRAL